MNDENSYQVDCELTDVSEPARREAAVFRGPPLGGAIGGTFAPLNAPSRGR